MRITGGKFKGQTLIAPKDSRIRPTSDKVRQAVFTALANRGLLEGAVTLDAFCGTGALGIEALSRGCSFCIFMDNNRNSIDLCRSNLEKFAATSEQTAIVFGNATKPPLPPEGIPKAGIVFLDPPYGKNLVNPSIDALYGGGWLEDEFIAVIETGRNEDITASGCISLIKEQEYGDTRILVYKMFRANTNRSAEPPAPPGKPQKV